MKYFKPKLHTQCRSLDETVAEPAAKEWEEAVRRLAGKKIPVQWMCVARPEVLRRACHMSASW